MKIYHKHPIVLIIGVVLGLTGLILGYIVDIRSGNYFFNDTYYLPSIFISILGVILIGGWLFGKKQK